MIWGDSPLLHKLDEGIFHDDVDTTTTSTLQLSQVTQPQQKSLGWWLFGDGSKPWYLVNPKIAGIYGCSSH